MFQVRTRPKYRKLEMLLNDTVPPKSEVSLYMGASLAQIFFEHGHVDTKKLLGVIPPLSGPQKELWISPSDQLIGKVSLKPPFTDKCIKACTHQGILAIGGAALEKYQVEMEHNMEKLLNERLQEGHNMCGAERRRAVELAEQNIRLQYEKYIKTLQMEFAEKLQVALAESIEKCNKMAQKAVVEQRMEVTQMMLKKIRYEISYIIGSLHESFEQSLRAQKESMVANFNGIMRSERTKAARKIEEIEREKSEALRVQRHELEMQNFADSTYVLCVERMRCSSEKHAIYICFEKKIEALEELLLEANDIVRLMKEETKETGKDDEAWEYKIREIIREFQKFINFAFHAVPGQAEFLLSLESLLVLELDDKIRKRKETLESQSVEFPKIESSAQFEVVEIIDKNGHKWVPIKLKPDTHIAESDINCCFCDYTDAVSVPSVQTLNSYDSLPFCYFENTMYVRSDYREGQTAKVAKTSAELAEGSRFIMELKKSKSCNPKSFEDVKQELEQSRVSPSLAAECGGRDVVGSRRKADAEFRDYQDEERDTSKQATFHEAQIQNLIRAAQRVRSTSNDENNIITMQSASTKSDKTESEVTTIENHLKMMNRTAANDANGTRTFKVMGEDGSEHLETPEQFTQARMRSLMRIFKLHPSLQRMLIPKSGAALY